MTRRDIIAIGGSAGSFDALLQIAAGLPADLPAAVFAVIHRSVRSPGYLTEIIQKRSSLRVLVAEDQAPIENGTLYVAPPDRHLLIRDRHIQVSRGPKEGLQRPSINVTFRSAAMACGNRLIGVLLSGMLDDGAAGIWEIAKRGGVTIVQDPAEAPFPSMPLSALKDAIVHHTLTAAGIASLLPRLLEEEIPGASRDEEDAAARGRFSGFTCPECRGPLYEGRAPHEFGCRVGHVMSLKTLLEEHASTEERKLYEAIVALEEGADLAERVASADGAEHQVRLRTAARQLRREADIVRRIVEERIAPDQN